MINAVSFEPDGAVRVIDEFRGDERVWATVAGWAREWFAERRVHDYGAAHEFIRLACADAIPGVVGALVTLAETSGDDDEVGSVGAGPLEDLLSHTGNGLGVLDEVERAARQNPAFRAALQYTWLASDVPTPVRERLGVLGATLLDCS